MFNAQQRIRQLMDERGWTIYRFTGSTIAYF